jgi:hypothetical protein
MDFIHHIDGAAVSLGYDLERRYFRMTKAVQPSPRLKGISMKANGGVGIRTKEKPLQKKAWTA